tara:strand:+ start:2554 stop:2718 length:165 start_codon:yes stop_codon:yes gene_type:complete
MKQIDVVNKLVIAMISKTDNSDIETYKRIISDAVLVALLIKREANKQPWLNEEE